MAIFELPEAGYRSNSHEARSKHWMKRVDTVDTTISSGYAFDGPFCTFESTQEAPNGAVFMAYLEDRRGSGQLDNIEVRVYRVEDDKLIHKITWDLGATGGWALRVRDDIDVYVKGGDPDADPEPDGGSVEKLQAERRKLLERVAEIDQQLVQLLDTQSE